MAKNMVSVGECSMGTRKKCVVLLLGGVLYCQLDSVG